MAVLLQGAAIMKSYSRPTFLAELLACTLVMPLAGAASAATISVTDPFVELENLSSSPNLGITSGEFIRYGAGSVIPNGNNGTTGEATDPAGFNHPIFFNPSINSPNFFVGSRIDNASLNGGTWTLTFTNGPNSVPIQLVSGTQQVPIIPNLTVTGTGSTPTFNWSKPSTAVNGYVVLLSDLGPTASSICTSNCTIYSVPIGNSTTFQVPATFTNQSGVTISLQPGEHYAISIRAAVTRDGTSNLSDTNTLAYSQINANFTISSSPTPTVNLPVLLANGSYQFNMTVKAGQTYYIDPSVTTGYVYKTGAGDPNFASVVLPTLQAAPYDLSFMDGSTLETVLLAGGVPFLFPVGGVDSFTVTGIDPALGLDPADTQAFVTGLTFVADGTFTGTQTPIAVPGPIAGAGLPGLVFVGSAVLALWRRRKAAKARLR
jgi:hypothetical protein